MKKVFILLAVLSGLGCAGIPISSMYKMMTANPLEFHPSAISVAIKRPHAIQMNTGDVKMGLTLKSKRPKTSISENFFLQVDNRPNLPSFLHQLKSGQAITVLSLSDEDVLMMQALQHKMKNHLNNGGSEDDLGFSVSVLRGCKNTEQIPSEVLVSLFLKLDARSDYFPLYQDFDLAKANLSPLKNLPDWDDCS